MIRPLAAAVALLLSACITHQGRPVAPISSEPRVQRDIAMARDLIYTPPGWPQALSADLYRPEGAGPFPAVIMVHGGGWKARTREDMTRLARAVARRGYVVMNVSYRLAPQWTFPAPLEDLQQAVLWLRARAREHGVDARRIGAWGYSAGAHLAALLAVTGPTDRYFVDGARVQAVVAGGTPVDLRYYKEGPLINGLMGVAYERDPERWRNASPVALVSADDPPMFLYHGTLDFTVGVENARAMQAALHAAGVPVELYLYRGLEHFATFFLSPVARAVDFLDRHLR